MARLRPHQNQIDFLHYIETTVVVDEDLEIFLAQHPSALMKHSIYKLDSNRAFSSLIIVKVGCTNYPFLHFFHREN